MYYIKKSDWDKIPEGYKGNSITNPEVKTCFLCFLTPDKSGGCALCFEHQHFEIVKG